MSGHVPSSTALGCAAKRWVAGLVAGRYQRSGRRELFTGQQTFEAHLSWAYRKLVVLSRTELRQLLVSPGPPQVPWHRFRRNKRVSRIRPGTLHLYGHTVDPSGEYPASRAFPG